MKVFERYVFKPAYTENVERNKKWVESSVANVITIFNHKMNLKYILHKCMVLMLGLSFAISHI
jgi:hypothetical protein